MPVGGNGDKEEGCVKERDMKGALEEYILH
jgi:hypothetical protein